MNYHDDIEDLNQNYKQEKNWQYVRQPLDTSGPTDLNCGVTAQHFNLNLTKSFQSKILRHRLSSIEKSNVCTFLEVEWLN